MSASDENTAPENESPPANTPSPAPATKASASGSYIFALWIIMMVGIILPTITLLVEFCLHLCGQVFIDPIPTWWHIALICVVVLVNFYGWKALYDRNPGSPYLPLGIGLAIGISMFYAAVFAPLSPIFFIALLFYGLGLLGLAPLLSLVSGILLAINIGKLRKTANSGPMRHGVLQGFALSVLAIILLEGPVLITHLGIVQANSNNPEESRAGIRLLRTFGSEQALLRDCYIHSRSVTDMSWLLMPSNYWTSIEDARKVFYRAYGRPFNSLPRPAFIKPAFDEGSEAWSDWDSEVASEQVGQKTAGVQLTKSELSGDIFTKAAVSDLQWTLVFSNTSSLQQEARAQIKLPPGGVITGAALWIDGEPHKAAFGERKLVRAAYQSVVSHRRDPLLVSASGPDRAMVQCFPIAPKSSAGPGQMKICLDITAPCRLTNSQTESLTLPRLIEKNFSVGCEHSVVLTSDGALKSNQLKQLPATAQNEKFGGYVSDNILSNQSLTVTAGRTELQQAFWSPAALSAKDNHIDAQYITTANLPPARLIVVIDGSRTVGKHAGELVAALATIPAKTRTQVLFASDENTVLSNQLIMDGTEPLSGVIRKLEQAPFIGGPPNEHYLATAYRLARNVPNTAILWLHGPQPLPAERPLTPSARATVKLYDFEVESGPNRIFDTDTKNANYSNIELVARTNNMGKDLSDLFAGWSTDKTMLSIAPAASVAAGNGQEIPELSRILVQLWAFDETKKLLAAGDTAAAVKLASHYRLVTPVTGAVVLETAKDYKEHGIDPENPDNNGSSTPAFSMSSAPEPAEYLLLAIALMFIAYHLWQIQLQRKSARQAA